MSSMRPVNHGGNATGKAIHLKYQKKQPALPDATGNSV